MKIAFLYAKGRSNRYQEVMLGASPSEFFYGAIELEKRGHQVTVIDVEPSVERTFLMLVAELLFQLHLLPTRSNGRLVESFQRIQQQLAGQDIIIATATSLAMVAGLYRLLGRLRAPVVGIVCGMLNYGYSMARRRVTAAALRRIHVTLFGDGEKEELTARFRLDPRHIGVNQFGVDTRFWTPGPGSGDYVLAVGNDARRDYALLVEVASKMPHRFVIVTNQKIDASIPSNVKILKGGWDTGSISDGELRELYRNALVVVTPLKESLQPSGQSVCLQAMACGKAVVITKTSGLWSSTMLRDGENVMLVRAGDTWQLQEAIDSLISDTRLRKKLERSARSTAEHEGSIEGFAHRLELLCRQMLDTKGKDWSLHDSRVAR